MLWFSSIRLILIYISRRYPCEDYVPQCRAWARESPETCTDHDQEAFGLMTMACMESCGVCKNEVLKDTPDQ